MADKIKKMAGNSWPPAIICKPMIYHTLGDTLKTILWKMFSA